jgi:hypothetical protein
VAEPASVLVSLADGYYTGSLWLDLVAELQATHGNLRRDQTLGVVLATRSGLFIPRRDPDPMPPEEEPEPVTTANLLAQLQRLYYRARIGTTAGRAD